jgi:cytochrome c oxidase cbb3-type subunit 4
MVSGIVTALLLLVFVGSCIWAWHPRHKTAFDAMARLPLDEENNNVGGRP